MWIVQPLEIAGPDGKPSGRWRMTATSDEGGGGPHGRAECSHASAEEAGACAQCDAWVEVTTDVETGEIEVCAVLRANVDFEKFTDVLFSARQAVWPQEEPAPPRRASKDGSSGWTPERRAQAAERRAAGKMNRKPKGAA